MKSKTETKNGDIVSFSGVYDPDEDSPTIKELAEEWKKDLARAIGQYVVERIKGQEDENTLFGFPIIELKDCYICPMCKGKKQIDKEKHGLWSPGDADYFCECPLCKGDGFVIKKSGKEK
ncbi:hypothetical protein KA005_74450 [bacterium]|nr:hypothetical protein [bacterium]